MHNVLSFENLPSLVVNLTNEVSELKTLLLSKVANQQPEIETPLNIDEVSTLIKKTVPTIYGYCQRNEIPFSKKGNRLYFFKSKIIDWLKESEVKTLTEIKAEADVYLSNHKKAV